MSVSYYESSAAFDQLYEVRIVVLGTCEQDLDLEVWLVVRLSCLELFECLSEFVDDEILRADHRYQCDDAELITCDGRVVELAVISDSSDNVVHLVVDLDRLQDGLVRCVHTELVLKEIEYVDLQLLPVVIDAVGILLERNVREGCLERRVIDNVVHVLKMLLESASDRAGLCGELGVDEVESALQSSLEE